MKERGKFRYALLLAGTLVTAAPGLAAESADTRISRLERELADLKTAVQSNNAAMQAPSTTEPLSPPLISTASGTKVQFYGFTRFDISYDSGKINPGNIALWAQPKISGQNDSEWNLTAGASRLGLNLSGPDTEKIKLTGNIEFDFLGGGTENNMNPRMRHAYLKAFWPASDFSILAGQTWDVHSSLIPFVDDPAIMWASGNIGTRHPQVRVTKGFWAGEKGRIEVAAAVSRTIGEKNTWPDPVNKVYNVDPGKDAALPTLQGRVAYSAPLLVSNQPATLAISGHYGQEEWDTDTVGTHKTLDSWSCNLEFTMPICPKITVAGEYFTGTNLDDYWGGVSQGVNNNSIVDLREIRSAGGWAALRFNANPSTSLSFGAGIDNPNDDDLKNLTTNPRLRNQTIFASVVNKITPGLILGFQLSDWKTDYYNGESGNALRAQSSLTYKF